MNRAISSIKWLYPGMRVKRWLSLTVLGLCLMILGVALFNHARSFDTMAIANHFWRWVSVRWPRLLEQGGPASWLGLALSLVGLAVIFYSISQLVHSIIAAIGPVGMGQSSLVDMVYRNRFLAQGARVVVIGGGTGLSTMLRGIKQYTSNIVAMVTVTDDGGSSGKLVTQLNILPPGDIRNCLVALADSEATMTDLFQYRFRGNGTGEGLRDHAFGNLLIAAMCDINDGDFEEAVRQTSRVLNIRGQVLPSTLKPVRLRAEMEDGSKLDGETTIASSSLKIKHISLCPADVPPLDEVVEAIEMADLVVIGPGSVYTSVIPNLLVRGVAEALHRSKAKKVYICNVMTQPRETDGFSSSDHLKAIEAHVPHRVINYVMVNTGVPSLELLNKYRQTGAVLVEPDTDRIRAMGYRPIPGNYISQTDVVRHDSAQLSEAIMRLLL